MIHFRKLTWVNWEECIRLKVAKEQENFIAENIYSIAESYVALLNDEFPPMSYAIFNDEIMVGFIMMFHDTAEENEFDDKPCYGICRFMIDRKYQRKGYGKKAMEKALDFFKTFPQGEANSVYLSYNPDNEVARRLYASLRFVETGQLNGSEVVAKLVL